MNYQPRTLYHTTACPFGNLLQTSNTLSRAHATQTPRYPRNLTVWFFVNVERNHWAGAPLTARMQRRAPLMFFIASPPPDVLHSVLGGLL
eukprot:2779520-Pyramimonas_sp.AAC.1